MVLDTETSSIEPGQICQLSYIIFDENFKIDKAFNQYFAVESVEEGASNVHGLTPEKLKVLSEGVKFKYSFADILCDLVNADKIFIHNSQFDTNFINTELSRLGIAFNFSKAFCTMKYHINICKLPGKGRGGEDYKWPRLSELLVHYKIPESTVTENCKEIFKCDAIGFHDSRFDIVALLKICELMKKNC
jgi:DNA polymerase-3 subunit epsilon